MQRLREPYASLAVSAPKGRDSTAHRETNMKAFLSKLCATTLAASFVAASAIPLGAAPLMAPQPAASIASEAGVPNVVQVQYNGDERWIRRQGREFRRDRDRRDDRRGFYRRGGV